MNENSTATREQRLLDINAQLTARKLKGFKKLGDHTKGEVEILSIVEFYDASARFFTDVKFAVAFPGNKPGEHTIRFNANGIVDDGSVIVAVVNGKFAIVKQWRPALGRWTYEVPRGFGKADEARSNCRLGTNEVNLPLATLNRELGENVMQNVAIVSVSYLGNIAENSGTNAVEPSYFLVRLQLPEEQLAEKMSSGDELKVELWDADRVRAELGLKLRDNHSITALMLAFNDIAKMARLTGL